VNTPRFLTTWPVRAKATVGSLFVVLVVMNVAVSARGYEDRGRGATGPTSTSAPMPPSSTSTSTSTSSSSTAPTTSTPTTVVVPTETTTTTTAAPPPATTPQGGLSSLAGLRVNDAPPPDGYVRDLFPTWLDLDLNGCDARDDTLTAESEIPVQRSGCDVTGGRWTSIYDGAVVTDPGALDVDHMVPLAEAWRSGAFGWDGQRRAEFANSLDDPDHLIAVTAGSNRSKSDSPPNEWRPPQKGSWCRYATAWTTIKLTWSLTVTTPERDALGQMLETC
jgi:hypothetical protein